MASPRRAIVGPEDWGILEAGGAVGGWGCKHEVNGICLKVDGALCRPGMKGCVLQGQVTFHDGVVPAPQWPKGHPRHDPMAETDPS